MTPLYAGTRERIAGVEHAFGWSSLSIDGHTWRWMDTGAAGIPIVLLPGSVGDAAMFFKLLEQARELPRLIALTYPALSDPKRLAEGLAGVLDHLGLDAVALAGSSFAAYWVAFFAQSHRLRLRALMLGNGFTDKHDLEGHPLFDRSYIETASAKVLHKSWLDRVMQEPATELVALQQYMLAERQTPENLHARLLGVVHATENPVVAAELPLTILDCPDDPLISTLAQERLRRRNPHATHLSIPGGGHYPHVLRPHGYAQALQALVQSAKIFA